MKPSMRISRSSVDVEGFFLRRCISAAFRAVTYSHAPKSRSSGSMDLDIHIFRNMSCARSSDTVPSFVRAFRRMTVLG